MTDQREPTSGRRSLGEMVYDQMQPTIADIMSTQIVSFIWQSSPG